jgi:hypothetical protein
MLNSISLCGFTEKKEKKRWNQTEVTLEKVCHSGWISLTWNSPCLYSIE